MPRRSRRKAAGKVPAAAAQAHLSKIALPRLDRIYPRERLFQRLDATCKHTRCIWIEGPPGAGKTTAVASYLGARGEGVLWYRLDAADTDVATFFHYMALAGKAAAPRFRRALPELRPEYLGNIVLFAQRFFEELYRRLKPPFALVFDGYQDVPQDSALHEVLQAAMSLTPRDIKVFVLSHARPPDTYARLRLHESLAVLDEGFLRADPEEALELAVLRTGRSLSPQLRQWVTQLCDLSQGWMAGLVLLIEGQAGTKLPEASIDSRDRQLLFDYFARVVFDRLDPVILTVLPRTAILGELTAKLAQQLANSSQVGAVLEELCRRNCFVTYEAQSRTYTYHPMFREFLLSRLRSSVSANEYLALQHRAAELLEHTGRLEEAINLYRSATDWMAVVRLLLVLAPDLARQLRFQTIAYWIDHLPLEVVADEPWLLYWRAMARMYADPIAARREFELAYDKFERNDDAVGLYLTFAGVIDCFQVDWSELTQVDLWIAKFERVRLRHPEFPSREVEVRAVFAIVAALANRHLAHPALPPWLARADAIIRGESNPLAAAGMELQRFQYLLWKGRRDATEAALGRIEAIALDPAAPPQLRLFRYLQLGYWTLAFGDLDAVFGHVAEGLEIAQSFGLMHWRAELLAQGVYASSQRGDFRTAREYLEQMRTVETQGRLNVAHYHALVAMLEMQQGEDFEMAWGQSLIGLRIAEAGGHQYSIGIAQHFLANIALAQGRHEVAAVHLDAAFAIANEADSDAMRLTCSLTRAALALERGQIDAAPALLAQALASSRKLGGMAQPFVSRAILARLYAFALQQDIEVPHVKSLIRKFDYPPPPAARISGCWPFPVKIYTLGRFEILIDDAPLTFPTKAQKKPLELMKALITYGGSQVREETLAGALWPESESDAAAAALKAAVHRVRKLIGESAIERHQGRLTLNLQVCWVDVVAFEQSLSDIEQACSRRDIETIQVCSERMLAAYPGGFLVTEHDVPWALAMRERLRARLLRHLEMSARLLGTAGKHEQAIACYQRGLEVDPLAEALYRGLMRVYFLTEHHADALRTYRRCQNVLHAELALRPSPETQRLARSMGFI